MSHTVATKHTFTCDRCGSYHTTEYPGFGDDGPLPDGWAELTMRRWQDGKPDATESRLFASLCHACVIGCGVRFAEPGGDC